MTTVAKIDGARLDDYAIALGKLVGNLQGLEFMLRNFLHHRAGEIPEVNLELVNVGDVVAQNAMTDFSSLGTLVDRYNATMTTRDESLAIRRDDIVAVRDALAHGRVYGKKPELPMRLLKFSRAKAGQVTVEFAENIDVSWLNTKNEIVRETIELVARAFAT